jgi:hypothetical protein
MYRNGHTDDKKIYAGMTVERQLAGRLRLRRKRPNKRVMSIRLHQEIFDWITSHPFGQEISFIVNLALEEYYLAHFDDERGRAIQPG